jgi:hypothetical protein
MALLVRSLLVVPSVMDLRFVGLVSWSGAGPTRTLWFAPPPWGPQAPPGWPSPPPPAGVLDVLCSGRLAGGCIIACASLGLRWRRRGRIEQAPIEQAEACGADGPQDTLSCAFAGGWGLATGVRALPGGLMRAAPQGVVLAPGPEVGPGDGRHVGAFSATRAAVVYTAREASQGDARCAVGVLGPIAHGAQASRRGRGAAPGQWHQAWGVRALGKQGQSLVEPEGRWSPRVAHSGGAHGELARVKARQVWETAARRGPSLEAVAGLRTPRLAPRAGRPRCQHVGLAGAPESRWGGWAGTKR